MPAKCESLLIFALLASGAGVSASAQALDREACQKIVAQPSPARSLEASRIALGLVDKFSGSKETQDKVLAQSTYTTQGASATLDLGAVAVWQQVFHFYVYSGSDAYLNIKYIFDGKPVVRPALQYRTIVEQLVPEPIDRALLLAYVQRDFAKSTPWSAAFISSVMREAGFDNSEFLRAIGHWRYISEAVAANGGSAPNYKYRACNPTFVRPREGDLVCNVREPPYTVSNYDELIAYVERRGKTDAGFTSHCDIVVKTNYQGLKPNIEVIGGNKGDTVKKVTLAVEEKDGDVFVKEADDNPMIVTLVATE